VSDFEIYEKPIDRFKVEGKNPNIHYRVVRTRENRVEEMKQRGYVLAIDKGLKHNLPPNMVLMCIPRDVFEKKQKNREEIMLARQKKLSEKRYVPLEQAEREIEGGDDKWQP